MPLDALWFGLAGGIGLFLLGMGLMTDGLKLAAGPALERILASSTRTRLRGLASGIAVTAVVQSSSAVTVATIGFVNAGLLNLGQALWVLFGANVGTTMTGWLVALVGLKFKIEALALPLIGFGMLLRLSGERSRRGALGMTLAGFGVLFLGIDMLKGGFAGLSANVDLPTGTDISATLAQVLIGIVMTVLMQSSSAALAIALTAAEGGLLAPHGAAAMVIGANIGTTATALIAAIGATVNAKRAAAAHIVFNLLTGAVALALLPWLLTALAVLQRGLDLAPTPATALALFHTAFNLLGVALIWPLTARLTHFLEARFGSAEEDAGRPRHLDRNVLAVPALALDALEQELHRLGAIARATVRDAFAATPSPPERDPHVAARLSAAIAGFIAELHRGGMSAASARRLPRLLRVARYYDSAAELAAEAAAAWREANGNALTAGAAQHDFGQAAQAVLARIESAAPDTPDAELDAQLGAELAAFERGYQQLKADLLAAGAHGTLALDAMDARLRAASALRRAVEQIAKAAAALRALARQDD